MDASNQALWDRVAGSWDDLQKSVGDKIRQDLLFPAIRAEVAKYKHDSILDAGCGNGALLRTLAPLGAELMGCDISSQMVALAQARTTGKEQYFVWDIEHQNPLLECKFDQVIVMFALQDVEDVARVLSNLHAWLKRDGVIVLVLDSYENMLGEHSSHRREMIEGRLDRHRHKAQKIFWDNQCHSVSYVRPLAFYLEMLGVAEFVIQSTRSELPVRDPHGALLYHKFDLIVASKGAC